MITALLVTLVAILSITVVFGSQAIMQLIFNFLYFICKWFLVFIDFCQSMFRSLVGLGPVPGSDAGSKNILFDGVLNNSMVRGAFFAILALSFFLVFGFALVQIIRTEWTTEGGKNAKGPIIKSALKSFFLFFLIPFCSMLGVYVSNMLLGVVDVATAGGTGSSSIAGKIFRSAVDDANPIRRLEQLKQENKTSYEDLNDSVEWVNGGFGTLIGYGIIGRYDVNTGIYWWEADGEYGLLHSNRGEKKVYYDNATKSIKGFSLITVSDGSIHDGITAEALDEVFSRYTYSENVVTITGKSSEASANNKASNLSIGMILNYTNQDAVYFFYNMHSINYIVMIVASWFALSALTSTLFGLVMRMYKVAILFIISPYPVSLSVLDNGSALNKWKGKFIGELFSAYGVVVGLNLFFILLPVFDNLVLFENNNFFNSLAQMLFVIIGCYMIKDIVSTVSEFTGGGDVLKTGEGMKKQVSNGVVSGISKAVGIATGIGAGASAAASAASQAIHGVGQAMDNKKREKLVESNRDIDAQLSDKNLSDADRQRLLAEKQNNSAKIDNIDSRQEARTAKLERGRSTYLRSKQLLVNKFTGNKAFQTINNAAGGILTADGRAKLDKAAAGGSEENANIIKSADKDRQSYGAWGRHLNSNSLLGRGDAAAHRLAYERKNLDGTTYQRQKGDSIVGFARKGELDATNRSAYNETYKLAMNAAQENNKAVKHVDSVLNLDNIRQMSNEAAAEEIKQAKLEIESIDISDAAKKEARRELSELSEAVKYEKGSDKYNEALERVSRTRDASGVWHDDANKQAQIANLRAEVSSATVSAEDIQRMKNNRDNKDYQRIVTDPDYADGFKKIIAKANEESMTKAKAMKDDQKTANVVPDIIRQVLTVLKDDKKK